MEWLETQARNIEAMGKEELINYYFRRRQSGQFLRDTGPANKINACMSVRFNELGISMEELGSKSLDYIKQMSKYQ